ncbi:MAG: exonuclease domain-containing protein [Acidimicrobiia bacterium]
MLTSPETPTRFDDLATPLSEVTFVVLDLETTGTSPHQDAITEIGAVKCRAGERLGTFDTLVNRIEEILPSLLEFIGASVLVGHNLRFDTDFLDAALLRRGSSRLENPRVDTLGISRRLLRADLPNLRLATLADHLGATVEPCHRALADAEATADVFHALLERAGTFGVLALDDLLAVPTLRDHPSMSKLRLLSRAPRGPGVYQLRDREGRAIYVSKATNLRKEIRTHFCANHRRVPQMVLETESIDWIECADDLEASVREVRLVRELEPRFNRRTSGWRKYAYLKLTRNARLPRLTAVRSVRDDGAFYFGPLRSTAAVNELRAAIASALPLRSCAAGTGPVAECQQVVDAIERGLGDDPDALLEPLELRMNELASTEQYEAAAAARDQLIAVAEVLRQQRVLTSLCRFPSTRFLTPSGVVELQHGFLPLGDDDPTVEPDAPLEPRRLDELLVVARWLGQAVASGHARPLDPPTQTLLGTFEHL